MELKKFCSKNIPSIEMTEKNIEEAEKKYLLSIQACKLPFLNSARMRIFRGAN